MKKHLNPGLIVHTLFSRKGFSLIEAVIAVSIMGVVIVTVLGVFFQGNQAMKKSHYNTVGINIAEKKLYELKSLLRENYTEDEDIYDYISTGISGNIDLIQPDPLIIWQSASMSPVTIEGSETLATGNTYDFEITINDYIDSTGSAMNDLKKATVNVYWNDPVTGRKIITTVNSLITKPAF